MTVSSNWSYQDIPIHKFQVITEPNLITGEIKQITDIAGKITEEIIQTKSDQIRNALIDLSWTPPEGKEHIPESKLPAGFDRDRWLISVHECYFMGVKIVDMPWHDLLATIAYVFANAPRISARTAPSQAHHAQVEPGSDATVAK